MITWQAMRDEAARNGTLNPPPDEPEQAAPPQELSVGDYAVIAAGSPVWSDIEVQIDSIDTASGMARVTIETKRIDVFIGDLDWEE